MTHSLPYLLLLYIFINYLGVCFIQFQCCTQSSAEEELAFEQSCVKPEIRSASPASQFCDKHPPLPPQCLYEVCSQICWSLQTLSESALIFFLENMEWIIVFGMEMIINLVIWYGFIQAKLDNFGWVLCWIFGYLNPKRKSEGMNFCEHSSGSEPSSSA